MASWASKSGIAALWQFEESGSEACVTWTCEPGCVGKRSHFKFLNLAGLRHGNVSLAISAREATPKCPGLLKTNFEFKLSAPGLTQPSDLPESEVCEFWVLIAATLWTFFIDLARMRSKILCVIDLGSQESWSLVQQYHLNSRTLLSFLGISWRSRGILGIENPFSCPWELHLSCTAWSNHTVHDLGCTSTSSSHLDYPRCWNVLEEWALWLVHW